MVKNTNLKLYNHQVHRVSTSTVIHLASVASAFGSWGQKIRRQHVTCIACFGSMTVHSPLLSPSSCYDFIHFILLSLLQGVCKFHQIIEIIKIMANCRQRDGTAFINDDKCTKKPQLETSKTLFKMCNNPNTFPELAHTLCWGFIWLAVSNYRFCLQNHEFF